MIVLFLLVCLYWFVVCVAVAWLIVLLLYDVILSGVLCIVIVCFNCCLLVCIGVLLFLF